MTSKQQRMIFINLPVKDLKASMAFYQALGFDNNAHFTDHTAACMVWSEAIHVMLITHEKWRTFTSRPIASGSSNEVLLALNCNSKAEVDQMLSHAERNGGIADINPGQQLDFMYSRSLADLDGHIWEPFWMDPAAMPA